MDILEFFQLCEGKWVSQRTTHYLVEQKNQSDRSDLWVEFVDAADPVVAELYQASAMPELPLGGLKIRWSEVAEAYQSKFKPKNEGSVLLVPLQGTEDAHAGQLLRQMGGESLTGTYRFGADEALTLYLNNQGFVTEERLWFASPNLRLRSSFTRQEGTVCITSFCSEIRMGATAPPAEAAQPSAP